MENTKTIHGTRSMTEVEFYVTNRCGEPNDSIPESARMTADEEAQLYALQIDGYLVQLRNGQRGYMLEEEFVHCGCGEDPASDQTWGTDDQVWSLIAYNSSQATARGLIVFTGRYAGPFGRHTIGCFLPSTGLTTEAVAHASEEWSEALKEPAA